MHETRQPDKAVIELRVRLWDVGYCPIPLYGKEPPVYGKNNPRGGLAGWEKLTDITPAMIAMHGKTWPDAANTGVLTCNVPTIDLDILDEEAAQTAETCIREFCEERGEILVRYGLFPKRAIPFRTDEPFAKIVVNLIAANQLPDAKPEQKIEFLGSGQQVVVDGIHPDTKQAYRWIGKKLADVRRDDLPYIREAEARALVDEIVERLEHEHGYSRAATRPQRKNNGGGTTADVSGGAEDWQFHFDNIHAGRELHDNIVRLAAKMIKAGMKAGAAVNQLRALMMSSTAAHDARWQERYDDIPRAVDSAEAKYVETPNQPAGAVASGPACSLEETLQVFEKWLILPDRTPVYAVLGTVAANLLPGDPVWLGLIAPPSSAKTEILNSLSALPYVAIAEVLTPAALLSGTPKKQTGKGATGGLLRQIGEFGIIAFKDFSTILDTRYETRGEMLAALRRVYDGEYVRQLGSDGGRTVSWRGKVGLVFASTQAYDMYHGVIGTLGDRFLLSRIEGDDEVAGKQFSVCLKHIGSNTQVMRKELTATVAALFAGIGSNPTEPERMTETELAELKKAVLLAIKLRAGVERDRIKRELEVTYDPEGPARLALCLERLFAGLVVIGLPRAGAMKVIQKVAKDSTPRFRLKTYSALTAEWLTTRQIATAIGLPTTTARRALEELFVHGLAEREAEGGETTAIKWRKIQQQQES
jgi:Bifunctional DNA primase/polymerase, N-terminal